MISSPALALQESEEAVADAAEAVAEAVEVAVEAVEAYEPVYPRDPSLRSWRMVKPLDFPIEAWQKNQEGTVGYSVEVDAKGKPITCKVTKSSDSETLDAAICPIVMGRGEFRPAMAGREEPVAGTYEGYHNWRKREPELPQMSIIYRFTHGADGKTSDCEFLKMENIPEQMREEIQRDIERGTLCKGGGLGNNRGVPYRDEEGNPVAKVVTVKFDVELEDPEEPVE